MTVSYYPLTSHTTTRPISAEASPIRRKVKSGVSHTLIIARLAWPGKAANTSPSITKTNPSAARKSDIAAARRQRDAEGAPGAAAGGASVGLPPAWPLPDGWLKKRKKFESGLSRKRVSAGFSPCS